MDLIRPLKESAAGYRVSLAIMDYVTNYPEVVLLCSMNAKTTASELMKVFAMLGLPLEILTNQETSFKSQVMR